MSGQNVAVTTADFADALTALADFYRKHPDTPIPNVGHPGVRLYDRIDADHLVDVLALNPDRIEPTSYGPAEFVWDFGAGVTLRRRVDPELVGEQVETTSTTFKLRTVEALRDIARVAIAQEWKAAFSGPVCDNCLNPGELHDKKVTITDDGDTETISVCTSCDDVEAA